MNAPYYTNESATVWHGDCLEVLRDLPDNSVDAIVTDPPYGLGFMGKDWDDLPPGLPWAQECLRVLKPGGHLLAFGGTRTWHRLAVAVEDAGFEMRDSIAWLYGSGFPKSLDVSKAIDKKRDDSGAILLVTWAMLEAAEARGITRADVNEHMGTSDMAGWWLSRLRHRCQIPTWDQWLRLKVFLGMDDTHDPEVWRLNGRKGTPGEAWEAREVVGVQRGTAKVGGGEDSTPWSVGAVQQGIDVTVTAPASPAAQQWAGWGSAMKPAFEPVVVARKPLAGTIAQNVLTHGTGALNIDATRVNPGTSVRDGGGGARSSKSGGIMGKAVPGNYSEPHTKGRWPTNVVLDDHAAELLDQQSGTLTSGANPTRRSSDKFRDAYGEFKGQEECVAHRGADSGGASRFFPVFKYQAKAPTRERPKVDGVAHPTCKPLALMRWLVRLVTPPGGVVLDPFAGSGTTGEACALEGFRAILVERETAYLPLIVARLSNPTQGGLFAEGAP
jgi:DNA modification methylase